jgi:hypothetical protein
MLDEPALRLMKKAIIIFFCLAAALPVAFFAAVGIWLPTSQTSLDKLKWKSESQLIALTAASREGRRGILFIRLKDAKEQFIAGEWTAHFQDWGDVMAVGRFPPGYSSSTGQRLYAVKGDKILGLSLEKLAPVVGVQESRNQAYLLMETRDGQKSGFCIMEWLKSRNPDCLPIRVENAVQSKWDRLAEHELIMRTASGTIYSVDPWEHGLESPKLISPDDDRRKFERARALLAEKTPPSGNLTSSPVKRKIARFLNLAIISDARGWSVHHVPLFSTLGWLKDGEHLLVKEQNRLGIYETATRSYAPLLREDGIGEKKMSYRNDRDLSL